MCAQLVSRCSIYQLLQKSRLMKCIHVDSWLNYISSISVLQWPNWPLCLQMGLPDAIMPQIPEDTEMYEAFAQMSHVWEMFQKSPEDESASKKSKKMGPPGKRQGVDQAAQLLQAMGALMLKLDAEQTSAEKSKTPGSASCKQIAKPCCPC